MVQRTTDPFRPLNAPDSPAEWRAIAGVPGAH